MDGRSTERERWTAVDREIRSYWQSAVVPALRDYISVPALSPHFDPGWEDRGALLAVAEAAARFVGDAGLAGATVEVVESVGRTPVLLVEVAPTRPLGEAASGGGEEADGDARTVLMYGHLDKQPEMVGWRDGFGPWTPRLETENGRTRLYGRGGADDGYAAYAATTILRGLQRGGLDHARVVMLIETSEESASVDLEHYVGLLADRIGEPDLVICLDSSAADLDRLWVTQSLRGVIAARLDVRTLTEGVHSGAASGVAPNPIRVARALLNRIEDPETGDVLVPSAHSPIPERVRADIRHLAELVGAPAVPLAPGVRPEAPDAAEQWLRRTHLPALSVIAADGIPDLEAGGNVTLPEVSLGLSLRIPPGADADAAATEMIDVLMSEPPAAAQVTAEIVETATGWAAPPMEDWLETATDAASQEVFGQPVGRYGEGGTIPFMAMLGERFPAAQFVVTGVLVPGSNAHGPNEFLDVGYATDLSLAVARILDAHARRRTHPRHGAGA